MAGLGDLHAYDTEEERRAACAELAKALGIRPPETKLTLEHCLEVEE